MVAYSLLNGSGATKDKGQSSTQLGQRQHVTAEGHPLHESAHVRAKMRRAQGGGIVRAKCQWQFAYFHYYDVKQGLLGQARVMSLESPLRGTWVLVCPQFPVPVTPAALAGTFMSSGWPTVPSQLGTTTAPSTGRSPRYLPGTSEGVGSKS